MNRAEFARGGPMFFAAVYSRTGDRVYEGVENLRLHTKIFDVLLMDPIAGSAIDSRKNIGPRGKFARS